MSESNTPPPPVNPKYQEAVKKQAEAAKAVKARRLSWNDSDGVVRYVVTGATYGDAVQEIAKIKGSAPEGLKAVFREPSNRPGHGWIAAGYLA